MTIYQIFFGALAINEGITHGGEFSVTFLNYRSLRFVKYAQSLFLNPTVRSSP